MKNLATTEELQAAHEQYKEEIENVAKELESMEPNMKAIERLDGVENRLKGSVDEYETTLQVANKRVN